MSLPSVILEPPLPSEVKARVRDTTACSPPAGAPRIAPLEMMATFSEMPGSDEPVR